MKVLASGRGIAKMLAVSSSGKYTSRNSRLVIENNNNLDSKWTIYSK